MPAAPTAATALYCCSLCITIRGPHDYLSYSVRIFLLPKALHCTTCSNLSLLGREKDEGPGQKRDLCLLALSPGGTDAEVVREFSLETKAGRSVLSYHGTEIVKQFILVLMAEQAYKALGCRIYRPSRLVQFMTVASALHLLVTTPESALYYASQAMSPNLLL